MRKPKCHLQLAVSKGVNGNLGYENTKFTRQNLSQCCGPLNSCFQQPNLKTFLGELQVYDMNFETAKYEHS